MRFLIISKAGDAVPLAPRLEAEGHVAKVYIDDSRSRQIGEGIINKIKIDDSMLEGPDQGVLVAPGSRSTNGQRPPKFNKGLLRQLIRQASPDLIIFDMVGFGHVADELKRQGFPVFGGALFADLLELDRSYGTNIMKVVKISIPTTFNFKYANESRRTFESAIDFVSKGDRIFVFKPNGNKDTSLTFVPDSKAQLLAMLEHWRDTTSIDDFDLQEKIDGVEVSTEGWFNGSRFIDPINSTMEDKRFMPGNLGPNTGSMGAIVWNYGTKRPRLFKEGLGRLEGLLRKSSYRGPIDLNTIVTKNKIYGLEWTARFGYDAIWALLTGLKMRVSNLIVGIANGTIKSMNLGSDPTAAIRITVPPYPNETYNAGLRGTPILGVTPNNKSHIFLADVMRKDGRLEVAGTDGFVGVVTAHAQTPSKALGRALRTIAELEVPNIQYRIDAGQRAERDQAKLREWGWI